MSYAYVGEPRYYAAFGTNLGAGVAVVCLTTFTYFYLKRENQRLDNGEDVKGVTEQQKARGYRFIL